MFYTKEEVSSIDSIRFAYLKTSFSNHIFTICLNRPEKKNAMNPLFMNEIAFALTHARWNDEVRVVVLRAEGTIFCAGADLKAFAGTGEPAESDVPEPTTPVRLGDAFNFLFKPCIARVHAPVYAGGFLLLGGCTHIVAEENALFGLPEVKRGLWPFQVMASLMPIVPSRVLLDWCMRGRVLSAQEAKVAGLVTSVVKKDDLDAEVDNLAGEIAAQAPLAIRMGIEAFHTMRNMPANAQHGYLLDMLQKILGSEDAAEGLRAFSEKRSPNWVGR